MAPSDGTPPTRLVICVDGAQVNTSCGHETNIHRIYAGIKSGSCTDSSGVTFRQVPSYVPSIGSADDVFSKERIHASVFGQGLKQIQDVYESCAKLTGPKDEVYLFGFSKGAFVVRAVASLMHQFGSIASAGHPDFARDFKKIVKEKSTQATLILTPTLSPLNTRPAPKIQFVGVFDTVNPHSEDLFDLSFNSSIQHMRHALALHEDRKALTPEPLYPEDFYSTSLRDTQRSFLQAWFIGNHTDIGGSGKKSGLSLYPLQWMMLEARACGLSVDIDGRYSDFIINPLAVAFPRVAAKDQTGGRWSCTTANKIDVTMQDIRAVHDVVLQNQDFAVKLNARSGSIRLKKAREPFMDNGVLNGYCDWAPQGTIIHASVYLLLDEHINVTLETKELKLQRNIEDYREKMLGSRNGIINTGFWLDSDDDDSLDPGAIRVLVCGNTGVGKSTLINKTFGVDVTQSSNRARGIHDVQQEIVFEGRPDLIVHDSGGFEAGAEDEFLAIEAFLKEKSSALRVIDRLHVIWFCVDINSPRTLQTATEKLFRAVSQYAYDVPIVVVATKKDEFLDIHFGAHRKELKKEGKRFDEEACEQYAEEKLRERIETIRSEMEGVPDGRLDACLAVSHDDEKSIAELSKTTSSCFGIDKVRLLYVRAQVTRIDLKVDLALCELMRRYKRLLRSASGSTFAPLGSTINHKVSINTVTKAIINCFGLPTVSADAALKAVRENVWQSLGTNMMLAVAESLQLIGVLGSASLIGIPVWAVSGAINASYVVPATCRLFLLMSCDLTFVLARSFKEVTFRAGGQPNERDVGAAARNYKLRGYSEHVHTDIKRLVPRRNILACFKAAKIQRGVEAIFTEYKDKLMEDIDLPFKVGRLRIGSSETLHGEDDASMEADSTLFSDLKEARGDAVELEANVPVAELSAERKVGELSASGSVSKKRHELEG